MEASIAVVATLVSGKWLGPNMDEVWVSCNYIAQSDMSNLALYSRGMTFASSALKKQYPELLQEDYSSVRNEGTCSTLIKKLAEKYGEKLKVQPSDTPFMEMDPIEEWAFAKGISREEAESTSIQIQGL